MTPGPFPTPRATVAVYTYTQCFLWLPHNPHAHLCLLCSIPHRLPLPPYRTVLPFYHLAHHYSFPSHACLVDCCAGPACVFFFCLLVRTFSPGSSHTRSSTQLCWTLLLLLVPPTKCIPVTCLLLPMCMPATPVVLFSYCLP